MTATAEHGPVWPDDEVSTEELARRKGVHPIASVDELAEPDTFESDEELEEFLADVYASRRADVGRASSSWTPTSPPRVSSTSYPTRWPHG